MSGAPAFAGLALSTLIAQRTPIEPGKADAFSSSLQFANDLFDALLGPGGILRSGEWLFA